MILIENYMIYYSESDHEGKANKELKGVAEEDALRYENKIIHSVFVFAWV